MWIQTHNIRDRQAQNSDSRATLCPAQGFRERFAVQGAFSSAIILSFVLSVTDAELRPNSSVERVLGYIDWVLTSIFTVELLMNFIADFFFPFFRSGWNLFDAVVVIGSIVSSAQPEGGTNLGALRIVRVLRAVRLLNKAGSLKMIVQAMFASIIPVANSFVLLTLITSIYATMGVNLFGDSHPELFGYFSTGMFTMFECVTADGWSDMVRKTSAGEGDDWQSIDHMKWIPTIFFVSFMIVAAIVLINIVIAVLLDEFLTTMANERASQVESSMETATHESHSLDPLMEILSEFRSADDLAMTIHNIYERLDCDGSGTVGFQVSRVCHSSCRLSHATALFSV